MQQNFKLGYKLIKLVQGQIKFILDCFYQDLLELFQNELQIKHKLSILNSFYHLVKLNIEVNYFYLKINLNGKAFLFFIQLCDRKI